MTEDRAAEALQFIERARNELGEVCAEGPPRRFRMSAPANRDRDTDLIIGNALLAAKAVLDDLPALLAEAWERGHFYCAAEQRADARCANPYNSEAGRDVKEKWIAFPGKVPVCQDCGADWHPVRRGECLPALMRTERAKVLRGFAAWAGLKPEPENTEADFAHNALVKAALAMADFYEQGRAPVSEAPQ